MTYHLSRVTFSSHYFWHLLLYAFTEDLVLLLLINNQVDVKLIYILGSTFFFLISQWGSVNRMYKINFPCGIIQSIGFESQNERIIKNTNILNLNFHLLLDTWVLFGVLDFVFQGVTRPMWWVQWTCLDWQKEWVQGFW